ncbi:MAG: hypothetical protein AAGA70_09835 [Pseudomonadota bacterium]
MNAKAVKLLMAAMPLLVGCAGLTPAEEAQAAEQVASTVIARVYPGINVPPMASCVRDNATADELSSLASYRDQVIGGAAQELTLRIVDRAETDACIRANGIILG